MISEQERAFGLQAGVDLVDHAVSAESVADGNAKALSLFAEGDAAYVTDDAPSIFGRPARTSNSSPPNMPQHSLDAQARVRATARAYVLRGAAGGVFACAKVVVNR